MRAWELHERFGIDALRLQDRPDPAPGPGQVRLLMEGWSLNFRDLLMVSGRYDPRLQLPFTPLSDGVGVVEAVGPGVPETLIGRRVAGCFMQHWPAGTVTDAAARSALGGALPGVAADKVVLAADGVVPVPEHLSPAEAATLPCAGVTAWNAVMVAGAVRPGDVVLVQGTGGVSLFALQFAHLAGARVIATSSSDDKLQRAIELGASDGINYKTGPDWGKQVRTLTGGRGVDLVVEVGGIGTLAQSLRAVRAGGTIALIGILSGTTGAFDPLPILMKAVKVQGIFVGHREMFLDMNRAVARHDLWPVVDRTFAFTELPQALAHMEGAGHFGKICLKNVG